MAQIAHLKGPEKEGKRAPVYFSTHADYVEGLDDKLENYRNGEQSLATTSRAGLMSAEDKVKLNSLENVEVPVATQNVSGTMKLYNGLGDNTDGTVTQKVFNDAITELSENTVHNTDIEINVSNAEPSKDSYWFYIESIS